MTEATGATGAPARPILLGQPSQPQPFSRRGGGSRKVRVPSPERQGQRLSGRVRSMLDAFASGNVALTDSVAATDPELVVVFEVIDAQIDLAEVASRLGMEVLFEVEDDLDPGGDFPRVKRDGTVSARTTPVPICLHATCANRHAASQLVSLWQAWVRDGRLARGYGRLAELFGHLVDVRFWGPQDRLRLMGVEERLAGLLDEAQLPVDVELWFRQTTQLRSQAEARARRLITNSGGRVISAANMPEIGYHALATVLPAALLRRLAAGEYNEIALVKATDVQYLRAAGQAVTDEVAFDATDESRPDSDPLVVQPPTQNEPLVCLLDGALLSNHTDLAGRVTVYDPDGLDADPSYVAETRIHGTAMASILVWGDINAGEGPARRPILSRPVLRAPSDGRGGPEEFPPGTLLPDLMRRVFRELFEPTSDGSVVAPSVCVINVSLGDPAMPFDVLPSAWARSLDWLSEYYGILLIVSAGNHSALPVTGFDGPALRALRGEDRREVVRTAVHEDAINRRLLSPAESLNSLTVGALHKDAAGAVPLGYRFDPADGEEMHNPLSAIGRGMRRAVKPEICAPGGRAFLDEPTGSAPLTLRHRTSQLGPGVRVASWSRNQSVGGRGYVTGTSPAAALVSRRAATLSDTLDAVLAGREISRRQRAVALKAMLVHEAEWPSLAVHPLTPDQSFGYGVAAKDLSQGCEVSEATVLFFGRLGAGHEQFLTIPLPPGLHAAGRKRVKATLAWLSPVNWRHRQYRRAKLGFGKPVGLVPSGNLNNQNVEFRMSQRGTLQQQLYETTRASSAAAGNPLALLVQCDEQAGGLAGTQIDYAVVITLWVAPELEIEVYQEVRDRVTARIPVGTRSRS